MFWLVHQPVSYLYSQFLFLLLINYNDCRRSMETADFSFQIFIFTLSCFSPKIEIFFWIVLPYSGRQISEGVMSVGW